MFVVLVDRGGAKCVVQLSMFGFHRRSGLAFNSRQRQQTNRNDAHNLLVDTRQQEQVSRTRSSENGHDGVGSHSWNVTLQEIEED